MNEERRLFAFNAISRAGLHLYVRCSVLIWRTILVLSDFNFTESQSRQ